MPFLSRNSLFALFFTLVYAVLLAWLMPYHELWFDETEPWLLALYSDSYAELLQNKAYEGHPNLWYTLLFVVTRFTHDLRALQATQFVFAVGFIFVFLRYAPFSRWFKLLVCFGYYGLFEYGLISRLYALELFFLFLVCTFYPKRFSHWYLYIILLVLTAQTHLFGLFFSGVMGLLLFAETFGIGQKTSRQLKVLPVQRWLGIILWLVGCLLALWSIARPSEITHVMVNLRAPTRPWQAFFPIPLFAVQFWNTSFLSTTVIGSICEVLLSLAIMGFVVYSLRSVRQLFLAFLLLFVLLTLFFTFKYVGSLRHFGHYFLFTLAFTWLLWHYASNTAKLSFYSLQKLLLTAACTQWAVGIFAIIMEVQHPFHPAQHLAAYLKKKVPDTTLMVTDSELFPAAVSAFYGKPLLYLPKLAPTSFFQFGTPEANNLTPYQLLDWATVLAHKEQRKVLLISYQSIDLKWYASPVKVLAYFNYPTITGHCFYLYEVNPAPFSKKYFLGGEPLSACLNFRSANKKRAEKGSAKVILEPGSSATMAKE